MDTYMVMFELPAIGSGELDLDGAYRIAHAIVMQGMASAYPRVAMPVVTVSAHVDRRPRAAMRWSIEVAGDERSSKGRSVALAFDASERRGAVVIMDDATPDPSTTTIYLRPVSMARLARAIHAWPMDMIDEMAREDEVRRRGVK